MVDYSKWKNIEISDDEDETHPNIDTPSLFRWRHQARVDRMEERKRELEAFEKKKTDFEKELCEKKKKLAENPDDEAVKKEIDDLKHKQQDLKNQELELMKKEKNTPWNVDTISKEGFTKTVVNKKEPMPDDDLSDEQKEKRMKEFTKKYEKEIKQYGMLRKYEDSQKFLQEHGELVSEDTASYLVLWCINLEMEEKHELMEHVAHQVICMQFMLELAKQLKVHPRACVSSFFSRIKLAEVEYQAGFDQELSQFKDRIRKRAAEKIQEALAEVEMEERQKRLGPGGLDPIEVFESLPDELKKCFESLDIGLLQETISKMDEADARYHMKRCVDSGLWLPDKGEPREPTETDDKSQENTSSDVA